MLIAALILATAYSSLILVLYQGWQRLPDWVIPGSYTPGTFISVLVPARNEEKRIAALLHSLRQQSYPSELFEVIVIDDFSEDRTAAVLAPFCKGNFRLIQMQDYLPSSRMSSKKKALETGIRQAQGKLIVTTDADCLAPPDWLTFMASFYENHSFRIFGAPVNFFREKNAFERFQSLDYLGMMGLTGAGIQLDCFRMANGANLAYEKQAFIAVDGFRDIDQIASGDDVLLMQKIHNAFPGSVGYLKAQKATITTSPQPGWIGFRQQRRRWASKATLYKDQHLIWIQGMVFLHCLFILLSLIVIPWTGPTPFLILFVSKMGMDYFYLYQMARFFKRKELMKTYFLSQILHIWYIFEIGFGHIFFKQFEWKGRKTR